MLLRARHVAHATSRTLRRARYSPHATSRTPNSIFTRNVHGKMEFGVRGVEL
jgi:hypothetical protein